MPVLLIEIYVLILFVAALILLVWDIQRTHGQKKKGKDYGRD